MEPGVCFESWIKETTWQQLNKPIWVFKMKNSKDDYKGEKKTNKIRQKKTINSA
jgi:hypothetical protein